MEEKIFVSDDNELGHSYYIYDDDYYYYDDDWDDDYYYYDDDYDYYSSYSYPSYSYSTYYYPYSSYYYPRSYYYDDYYWYDDDYYYRRRESRENRLTLNGDTLRVGSNYDNDIWLNNVSGSYANVRVINAENNSHNLFITGNSRNNSIIGGNGNPTLWGGGGYSNTIKGGARRDVFWYEGGSNDIFKDFGTDDSEYSDVVHFSNVTWTKINRDDRSITFNTSDGNYIQLQFDASSYEDPILYSEGNNYIQKMKIASDDANGLTYRNDVHVFSFNQPGQIFVNGSDNNVWLGGEGGQVFINTVTINGGGSSGYNNFFSGNSESNVIYGGSGFSTMWGGSGTETDTLIGGEGSEVFRVGKNEGNDVVYTNQGHDMILLYDTNLSEIISAEVVGDVVSVGFNTGNTLTVHNTEEVTPIFQLSDGQRYNYNRSTNQWQNA